MNHDPKIDPDSDANTAPASVDDAPQSDPEPAKKHGDPLTDIDEEMQSGGGGNA